MSGKKSTDKLDLDLYLKELIPDYDKLSENGKKVVRSYWLYKFAESLAKSLYEVGFIHE